MMMAIMNASRGDPIVHSFLEDGFSVLDWRRYCPARLRKDYENEKRVKHEQA